MRWLAAACLLVLFGSSLVAQAQVQPDSPPDASAFTAREDLATAGSLQGAQRVLRFVQVSDAHILDDDAPYPMRQEQLDPYITAFSSSAQRPQDEFTDEVLESTVRAINAQHASDGFQFVINTGDNIDNDLENELMRFIDLWDGTATTTGPVSGLACAPDGQSTDVTDEGHDVEDKCTSLPESLLANRTALAPGLPWYSAFGNHDGLIQGNVNPNEEFDAVAAQHGRHFLTQPEYVFMHFPGGYACDGGPVTNTPTDGHGYAFAGERLCDDDPDNDGYYAFELGGVRFLVLDTLNDDFASANGFAQGTFNPQTMAGADVIGGYAEGAIDPAQMEWLRAEVAANPDKLITVFSHHTVNSMFTNLADGYCQEGLGCLGDILQQSGYGTGEQLTAELAAQPNVVGWIGGHTHRNRIEAKGADANGFWNIESSSLIDYPQQARVVELWVTDNGTKAFWLLKAFTHDFQLSKDLEATDPQRVPEGIGDADDQDTILWFDVPEGVDLTPMPPPVVPGFELDWGAIRDPNWVRPGEPFVSSFRVVPTGDALPTGLSALGKVTRLDEGKGNVTDLPQGPIDLVPGSLGDGRPMLRGEVKFTATGEGPVLVEVRVLRTVHGVTIEVAYNSETLYASNDFPYGNHTGAKGSKTPMTLAVPLMALTAALVLARRR
ncbi:MAG: metallophosphoesterase [Candidatus Thermoplasmatota archaeon]